MSQTCSRTNAWSVAVPITVLQKAMSEAALVSVAVQIVELAS